MAVQLTATDTHLTSVASPLVSVAGPLSLSTWINHSSWNAGTASIVGAYLAGTTGIQIGTRGANQIDIWTWGGGLLVSSNTATYTPTNGTWIHIAYTCNGTSHQLYAEGNLVATATTAQIAGTMTQMYINGYPTGVANETSAALVDDVVFYNRVISADEVKTIASLRGSRDGIVHGALARYKFDELTPGLAVVSVTDYTGNGRTLTPSGAGATMTYIASPIDIDTTPVHG